MSVRTACHRENGSHCQGDPKEQYIQLPYSSGKQEKKRDMVVVLRGGQKFPLLMCLMVTGTVLLTTVVIMPILAFITPLTPRTDITWWKATTIYHIYVRSYQDSDGNGVGDLKGIESRLDYLQNLGVGALWLSPIYQSPMVDFGYDVSNHTAVEQLFGTIEDFDDLVKAIHSKGMKVIIDFVPNHTSDKHAWFTASRMAGDGSPFKDLYIWSDGRKADDGSLMEPNNWLSSFGGPAWTWDSGRQQYYYHRYSPQQPDLNYRNPLVRQNMKDVLHFWLAHDVDGFRLDAIDGLFEVEDLSLDEPRTFHALQKEGDFHYLKHIYTAEQPETLTVLSEWRQLLTEYQRQTGKYIFLLPESFAQFNNMPFWKSLYSSGADMPANFALASRLKAGCGGQCVNAMVESVLQHVRWNQGEEWLNWVAESHDQRRLSERVGKLYAEAVTVLTLLLPGTPVTYYGQELGMRNIELTYEQTVDPKGRNAGRDGYKLKSRDPSRGPMQWNSEVNGGFSTAQKTWMPLSLDYKTLNVEVQQADKHSFLNAYRMLLELRKESSVLLGQHFPMIVNKNIYSFCRLYRGRMYPRFIVAMNLGEQASTDNYFATKVLLKVPEDSITIPIKIPEVGTVVYRSPDPDGSRMVGDKVSLTNLTLRPGQAIVIKV